MSNYTMSVFFVEAPCFVSVLKASWIVSTGSKQHSRCSKTLIKFTLNNYRASLFTQQHLDATFINIITPILQFKQYLGQQRLRDEDNNSKIYCPWSVRTQTGMEPLGLPFYIFYTPSAPHCSEELLCSPKQDFNCHS